MFLFQIIKEFYKPFIIMGFLLLLFPSCTIDYLSWTLPQKAELEVSVINVGADRVEFKGKIKSENIGKLKEIGFLVVRGNDFSLAKKFPIQSKASTVHSFTLMEFEFSSYYEVKFYVISETGESRSQSFGFMTPSKPGSPKVIINLYNNLSLDNVNVLANLLLEGSSPVSIKGFCWSTTPNPTINNTSSNNGSGIGSFSHKITNLKPETTYYIRAYATNQIATSYSDQIEITTKGLGNLAFGDLYQGGIFFYLLKPGDIGFVQGETHGLLAAPEDQGRFSWGCGGTNINTVDVIGAGLNNTQLIANNCGENNIAAKVCNNLSLNGYSDWFLPSRGELILMYENLHLKGYGNFSITPGDNNYWSSSQFNNVSAWFRSFAVNTQNSGSKTGTLRVRAIRRF